MSGLGCHFVQSFQRGLILPLWVAKNIRRPLGRGNVSLHIADIRQTPMVAVVEDSDGGFNLVFQVWLYQFAQTHTLAAHIAAFGHTGVEETQFTLLGIGHTTYEVVLVAIGGGGKLFGTCGDVVATKDVVDYLVAVGHIVERGFEYLAEGFG